MTVSFTRGEIGAWHKDTFPTATLGDCIAKLKEEAQELEDAVGTPEWLEELADVALVVFAIADRYGVDLQFEMERKFEINKQRGIDGRWKE